MTNKKDEELFYKNSTFKGYGKAYIYWYIEMLKPENERDERILNEKYKYARNNIK